MIFVASAATRRDGGNWSTVKGLTGRQTISYADVAWLEVLCTSVQSNEKSSLSQRHEIIGSGIGSFQLDSTHNRQHQCLFFRVVNPRPCSPGDRAITASRKHADLLQ